MAERAPLPTATTTAVTTTQLTAPSSGATTPLHDNGHFIKHARLELEQAWSQFQCALQALPSSTAKEHLLAHMGAARPWKSWGDLKQMQKTLLLMGTIARQDKLDSAIDERLNVVRKTVENVLAWLEQTDWA